MPIKKIIHNPWSAPIKIWTDHIDENTIKQLENMATLPFIYKHIAVMPDAHLGKGACVGSVIATENAIIPSAVGVDIGCGMIAARIPIDINYFNDKTTRDIRNKIERDIPVGFGKNKLISANLLGKREIQEFRRYGHDYCYSLGTLGGGNHFIEICCDQENQVWCVIHSGSRGFGKDLAEKHIDIAKGIMRDYFISLPDPDLAYLASETEQFKNYIYDLHVAQEYAYINREEMLDRVFRIFERIFSIDIPRHLGIINCHHNYTSLENHFGKNIFVTRKGAIRAREGDMGIIPGSMGNNTYIIKGKGNPESFCSCAHGAGRQFSRSQARKLFDLERLNKETEGVECRKDAGVLDEIPSSYKSIEQVMDNQTDLVEIVNVLKQFICIKG